MTEKFPLWVGFLLSGFASPSPLFPVAVSACCSTHESSRTHSLAEERKNCPSFFFAAPRAYCLSWNKKGPLGKGGRSGRGSTVRDKKKPDGSEDKMPLRRSNSVRNSSHSELCGARELKFHLLQTSSIYSNSSIIRPCSELIHYAVSALLCCQMLKEGESTKKAKLDVSFFNESFFTRRPPETDVL